MLEERFLRVWWCRRALVVLAALAWPVEATLRQRFGRYSNAPAAVAAQSPAQAVPMQTSPARDPYLARELEHSEAENKWLRRELERFVKQLPPAGAPPAAPGPAPPPPVAALPPPPAPAAMVVPAPAPIPILMPLAPAPPPLAPPAPSPAPAPNPWEIKAEQAQRLTDAEAALLAKDISAKVTEKTVVAAGTSAASDIVDAYREAGRHLAAAVARHLVTTMPMGCDNCAAYAEKEAASLFQKALGSQDLNNKVTTVAVNAAKQATMAVTMNAAEREALRAVELGGWERALTHYLEEFMKSRLENAMDPINDELRRAARQTARVAVYGAPPSPSPAPGPVVVAPIVNPFSVRNAAWRIAQATNYGMSPAAPPVPPTIPVPAPAVVPSPAPALMVMASPAPPPFSVASSPAPVLASPPGPSVVSLAPAPPSQ